VPTLEGRSPGTSHVIYLGLDRADDSVVASLRRGACFHAGHEEPHLVDLCILHGAPPQVVWLRVGNCPTSVIRDVLDSNHERLRRFELDESSVVLSLFRLMAVDSRGSRSVGARRRTNGRGLPSCSRVGLSQSPSVGALLPAASVHGSSREDAKRSAIDEPLQTLPECRRGLAITRANRRFDGKGRIDRIGDSTCSRT
jgi:predicted nuclease of predicted toxin-antitoxin system